MTTIQSFKQPSNQHPDPESSDEQLTRFNKSLKELRDLRSQLHYAADHCEATFLSANNRKVVIEDTKHYICKAVVTVVDHLGSISSNLNGLLIGDVKVSQTEMQIDCMKQRILACQNYTHYLSLSNTRWKVEFPKHQQHYILSNPPITKKTGGSRDASCPDDSKSTENAELSVVKFSIAKAILDIGSPGDKSTSSKTQDSESSPKSSNSCDPLLGPQALSPREYHMKRPAAQGSNFLSFLRRSKRSAYRKILYG
ncbi:putative protein ABIL5 [Acorus gramineus]|uniref:Protein ABIL5 n=1 Tax=Acorus gramineus TaxID=55184 RepID=A0AAV9APH7_ACOGR|nr:putative protein ABIL5 [Acorus gramineus]